MPTQATSELNGAAIFSLQQAGHDLSTRLAAPPASTYARIPSSRHGRALLHCAEGTRYYCKHMKVVELAITKIGNSRGIRIPADILHRYKIGESIILEEREGELILRPKRQGKLSWKETYAAMAAEGEAWSDWDGVSGDGVA
jgi:antitoxin component of MazEF toxin-antitoxin module